MSALIDLTKFFRKPLGANSCASPLFLKFFESLLDTATIAARSLTPTFVSTASWRLTAAAAQAAEVAAVAAVAAADAADTAPGIKAVPPVGAGSCCGDGGGTVLLTAACLGDDPGCPLTAGAAYLPPAFRPDMVATYCCLFIAQNCSLFCTIFKFVTSLYTDLYTVTQLTTKLKRQSEIANWHTCQWSHGSV
jgi:hypothetical protein